MKLRIRNWRQFQHYSDRQPPWIKLHFRILSSYDWVMLSDTQRLLAIACMLIASQSETGDGEFEADPEYVKRVAHLDKTPDFKPLIDCGFLEAASGCEQMLADASCSASVSVIPSSNKKKNKSGRKQKTEWPADFVLTDTRAAYAKEHGHDPAALFELFHDKAMANDYRYADWDAAWRNWCRSERNTPRGSGNGQTRKLSAVEQVRAANEQDRLKRGNARPG